MANCADRIQVLMMDLWCFVPYYNINLCGSLKKLNVEVTLASITYHLDPDCFSRSGLQNDPGVSDVVGKLPIRTRALRRALKFAEFCGNLTALAVRLAVCRPHVVHVQAIPLVEQHIPLELWFLQFAQKLGVKVVYTVHDKLPHDTGACHIKTFARVYQMADVLISHTNEVKRQLTNEFGIDPGRIRVIPHGPLFHESGRPDRRQARARYGFSNEECVVLWQGIVRPYKGVPFLLQAWRRIQEAGLNARLVIAGQGEERCLADIRRQVAAFGIQHSVQLELRYIPAEELPALYVAADIAIYPYSAITTSGALMTGLSYGKAIVATKLPAFQELLGDGDSAVLVDYADVEGLSNALATLIRDPNERSRLGKQAARLVDSHNSWAAIAEMTKECYEDLLRHQPPSTVSVHDLPTDWV